jgi:dihydrofolate reductase
MCFPERRPQASAPAGVEFISGPIGAFVKRLCGEAGNNIWLMGGGEIIASFLDEDAIDEFIISVVPILIGEGIPLIAPRHRQVPLNLRAATPFPDGVVQLHYDVRPKRGPATKKKA